jgi:hypothetical protein
MEVVGDELDDLLSILSDALSDALGDALVDEGLEGVGVDRDFGERKSEEDWSKGGEVDGLRDVVLEVVV